MGFTPSGVTNYTHLNANGTTTIKSGAGGLHTVTVNVKGGTGSTVTVYDNTTASGTIIAVIDPTQNLVTMVYDITFLTGLTVVLGGGTAPDITISWM
jgi:hypothetical protein